MFAGLDIARIREFFCPKDWLAAGTGNSWIDSPRPATAFLKRRNGAVGILLAGIEKKLLHLHCLLSTNA